MLSSEFVDEFDNDRVAFLNIFLIFAVPVVVLFGTPLVFSLTEVRRRLVLYPLFGAMVLVLFFLVFSILCKDINHLVPLRFFFGLGPGIVSAIWMLLVFVRKTWKTAGFFLQGVLCVGVAIPCFFILPMRREDAFYTEGKSDWYAESTMWSLIGIGSALVIGVLVYFVMRWAILRRARRE